MKAICPRCNKKVGAYVPRGGDGSAVRLRMHDMVEGDTCKGSWSLYELAEVVIDE